MSAPTYRPTTTLQKTFAQAAEYFPTDLQQWQFFDKYSRYDYNVKRRETWVETVDRAVNHLHWLSDGKLSEDDYEGLRQGMLNLAAFPAMRLLAMAGEAARRQPMAIFNCSAIPILDLDCFVDALVISMAGTGVGYSVERQFVDQIQGIIQPFLGYKAETHVIEDSTEGWAEALRTGLHAWANGRDVLFDYSLIRPAGAILKVKGGRASGPEPLRTLLDYCRNTLLNAAGRKLTTLECHDMMCVMASCVVSGGVRRVATIALFDWDDQAMMTCKNPDNIVGNEHRWNANNSAVWPEHISDEQIDWVIDLMASQYTGEPGIFHRAALRKSRPERRTDAEFLTNPCVTADTWVLTTEGYEQVRTLQGKPFTAIVDGKPYASSNKGFWYTGDKPTIQLVTKTGYAVECTPNHQILIVRDGEEQWVEAQTIGIGDAIVLHNHRPYTDHAPIYQHITETRIVQRMSPIEFDGDFALRLNAQSPTHARRLLLALGVQVYDNNGELIIKGDHAYRMAWHCYNLTKGTDAADEWQVLAQRYENDIRPTESHEAYSDLFERRRELGVQPVYDCTIEEVHAFDANGLYVHNCGEIVLRPFGVCNLSNVVCRADDTIESLMHKVKLATIMGTIQSMATEFVGVREEWRVNAREERLLGVCLDATMDCAVARDPDVQAALRDYAIQVNKEYAERLGIPQSAGVTAVKPSGNASVLLGSASGLHARYSPYYIRRVRVNAKSALYKVLKANNVPLVPESNHDPINPTTWVATFVVESPEGAICVGDWSVEQQLAYWLQVKRQWTEHNPSVTIYYKTDKDVAYIKAWLKENRDLVGGISFLPHTDHVYELPPYEPIDKSMYHQLKSALPAKIDFSLIAEYEDADYTQAAQELACVSGVCEVVF